MEQWYYTEGGAQRGPVGGQEIRNLLAANRINATTLVWREGMQEWTAAGNVPELDVSPYASPATGETSDFDWSGYTASGPQVRPWVRY